MKIKILPIIILFLVFQKSHGQSAVSDSAKVAETLKELAKICRTVDFADTNTYKLGTFYKAAKFIIYRGDDEKRAWKDFANYKNSEEKEGVDNVCLRINRTINQDTNFVITKFETYAEREGKWHILHIDYMKKGEIKKVAFAFLFVKGRYGLGDID